jgi:hypothetical protein
MIDENNIDDFEQFLRNQADKHRMYPSDQIWRNINQQLHGNSRWPALTFAAILTGALLTAGLIFLHPEKDLFKLPTVAVTETTSSNTIATGTKNVQTPATVDITSLKPVDEKTVIYPFSTPVLVAQADEYVYSNPAVVQIAAVETALLSGPVKNEIANSAIVNANLNFSDKSIQPVVEQIFVSSKNNIAETTLGSGVGISDDDVETIDATKTAITSSLEYESINAGNNIGNEIPEAFWADEKAIGNKKKTNRFSVQIYGGSNISYRRLSEPESYDYHFPYNPAITTDPRKNVNNYVSQRAAIGFEFGTAVAYALTDRLKIKAGIQFNLRQYNIDAFKSVVEPAVLLISNSSTFAPDSVMVYSSIRNNVGSKAITLQNRYYQIGIPVGIDWTFVEGRKVNFSLGATVQPTYQLNTNMYMITSDYKNYVQQPDMVRRWNFNAGAEAMANFNAGGLKWQVGPQLRYQMTPTQSKSLSVHEHLIDYGVKVGIIKQLK